METDIQFTSKDLELLMFCVLELSSSVSKIDNKSLANQVLDELIAISNKIVLLKEKING